MNNELKKSRIEQFFIIFAMIQGFWIGKIFGEFLVDMNRFDKSIIGICFVIIGICFVIIGICFVHLPGIKYLAFDLSFLGYLMISTVISFASFSVLKYFGRIISYNELYKIYFISFLSSFFIFKIVENLLKKYKLSNLIDKIIDYYFLIIIFYRFFGRKILSDIIIEFPIIEFPIIIMAIVIIVKYVIEGYNKENLYILNDTVALSYRIFLAARVIVIFVFWANIEICSMLGR